MVTTVVMVEKRQPELKQVEPKRAPRSAKPRAEQPARYEQPESHTSSPDSPSAGDRYRRISRCAYFKAERRGFEPGHMWEDWLAAEREVDSGSGM